MTDERWDRLDALAGAATPCDHRDERGSTVMLVRDDRYECAVCGATFRLLPDAAVRERDELREALKIIAADRPDWTPESISVKARNIARAALNRAALHREAGT